MRIHVYLKRMVTEEGVSRHVLAFADGLKRHGVPHELRRVDQVSECDLAICWSARKTRQIESGRRHLILERGYVGDRKEWTSVALDGLNGYGDFAIKPEGMPGDRWQRYFADEMRPWRRGGHYVLIMGQVPGDASLRGLNIHDWMNTMAQLARGKHEVKFRFHPLDRSLNARGIRRTRAWARGDYLQGPLDDAFRDAKYVVTYNSNSGVDAVLRGVPTVTMDRGSMAWDMSGHDPGVLPPTPDRTQWAHNLAYCQWSMEEMANGDAWNHIKGAL